MTKVCLKIQIGKLTNVQIHYAMFSIAALKITARQWSLTVVTAFVIAEKVRRTVIMTAERTN